VFSNNIKNRTLNTVLLSCVWHSHLGCYKLFFLFWHCVKHHIWLYFFHIIDSSKCSFSALAELYAELFLKLLHVLMLTLRLNVCSLFVADGNALNCIFYGEQIAKSKSHVMQKSLPVIVMIHQKVRRINFMSMYNLENWFISMFHKVSTLWKCGEFKKSRKGILFVVIAQFCCI